MDLQTVLFFGMGMMVEVFNILRSNEGLPTRKNIFKYLFVFAFPLSALLPGKKEKEYDLIVHVFSYFILLGTTTAVLFRDEILPIIRERTMLMFTLIFWYLQASTFGLNALLHPVFAIPFGFTALVLVNAFSQWNPPSFVKVMITVWFFIMAFVIGWMTLGTPLMNMFDGQGIPPSGIEAFSYGISFFYLLAIYFSLFMMVPIPGKHQTFKSRMQELKEYVGVIVSKYDNAQIHVYESLAIVSGAALVFGFNMVYNYVSSHMLVSIIFVGVNALEAFDRQKSPAVLRKKTRVKKIAAKDVKKTTAGEHGKNSDAETESQK